MPAPKYICVVERGGRSGIGAGVIGHWDGHIAFIGYIPRFKRAFKYHRRKYTHIYIYIPYAMEIINTIKYLQLSLLFSVEWASGFCYSRH